MYDMQLVTDYINLKELRIEKFFGEALSDSPNSNKIMRSKQMLDVWGINT